MRTISRRLARARGLRCAAVIVELAIVIGVIVVFFFGLIEIYRLLLLHQTADTAAYEGARFAMVPGASVQDARSACQALLDAEGLKDTSIVVLPTELEESTAEITVRVVVPVAANSWISFFHAGNRVISSEVTLLTERPPIVRLIGIEKMKYKVIAMKAAKAAARL